MLVCQFVKPSEFGQAAQLELVILLIEVALEDVRRIRGMGRRTGELAIEVLVEGKQAFENVVVEKVRTPAERRKPISVGSFGHCDEKRMASPRMNEPIGDDPVRSW